MAAHVIGKAIIARPGRRPRALVHDGTHERAGAQINRRVCADDGLLCLWRRHRLTREDGLVAFQLVGLEDPQVGWNHATHPLPDDVTRDELAHV